MSDSTPVSPRLQQLQSDLGAGTADALATFWAEITTTGTPLVERLPDDPTTCLVTFLWRETEPIRNMVVVEWFSDEDLTLESLQMTHLAESDVWYRTLRMRSNLHGSYRLLPNDTFRHLRHDPDHEERFARMMADPLNPARVWPERLGPADDPDFRNGCTFALPDAPELPASSLPTDVPHSEVIETIFTSTIMEKDYRLWIHLPANHAVNQTRHRLLLQVDGEWCVGVMDLPWLLDGLAATGEIPPLIAVMIDTPDRGVDLPCNPLFADFLADELIPHLRKTYRVADGPQSVIAAGQSYGGLAAVWVALKRPDAIGNAFCQSGSFWWWEGYGTDPEGGWPLGTVIEQAWLPGHVAREPGSEVRFWLEAGVLEDTAEARGPNLLASHRHMRDVLLAKGYDVAYREYPGGHDFHVWRGLYPDGLIHLTREPV